MIPALRVTIIIRKSVSHWDQTRTVLLLDRTSCSCSAISIYTTTVLCNMYFVVVCIVMWLFYFFFFLLRMLCLTMCDKTTQKLCIWWLTPLENEIKDVYIYIHTYGTWLVFPLLRGKKPFLLFTAEPMLPDHPTVCVLLCSVVCVRACVRVCVCVCVCATNEIIMKVLFV